jgi:hypothetical protein
MGKGAANQPPIVDKIHSSKIPNSKILSAMLHSDP